MPRQIEPLYKVLNEDATPYHGGHGKWNMHGTWMPPIKGDLVPCKSGYHLCRKGDLVSWLGPVIWIAKYRGERIDAPDKIVVREARLVKRLRTWNDRTARLFACDCAERAIRKYVENPDPGSVEAVRVARLYAKGESTKKELAAAWATAWVVAGDVASAAAWAAAWDAARAAAGAAAGVAAWDAARAAARAARAAAWDAASAAAWAAASATASAAARDAEKDWQTRWLFEYLEGKRK